MVGLRRTGSTPGRKPAGEEKEPSYFCPVEGCNKAYGSYGGLYLHKRSHHPELISKPAPKTEEEKEEAKKAIKDHRDMMPKKPLTAYVHEPTSIALAERSYDVAVGSVQPDTGKVRMPSSVLASET